MQTTAPDLNSRRSRLADWVELQTFLTPRQSAPISIIRSQVRRQADDRAPASDLDADADDGGEAEITERLSDDLEQKIFEELEFRARSIGDSYPFQMTTSGGGRSQTLRLHPDWSDTNDGRLVYAFCLFDSAFRDGLISYLPSDRKIVDSIGKIFQICSCVAVAGYTQAEVVSFGFPRAAGDSFLTALQRAWQRYGSYDVRTHTPYGFDDRLKDGGIDIIAWRPFTDLFAATMIMFVQVASGMDWKDKEVASDVRTLRNWFSGVSMQHFLPAICIPFPLWFDLDEPTLNADGVKSDFATGVRSRFIYREGKFGVIFDRGRIACFSARALVSYAGNQLPHPVDGIERMSEVKEWLNSVISSLKKSGAAS